MRCWCWSGKTPVFVTKRTFRLECDPHNHSLVGLRIGPHLWPQHFYWFSQSLARGPGRSLQYTAGCTWNYPRRYLTEVLVQTKIGFEYIHWYRPARPFYLDSGWRYIFYLKLVLVYAVYSKNTSERRKNIVTPIISFIPLSSPIPVPYSDKREGRGWI